MHLCTEGFLGDFKRSHARDLGQLCGRKERCQSTNRGIDEAIKREVIEGRNLSIFIGNMQYDRAS